MGMKLDALMSGMGHRDPPKSPRLLLCRQADDICTSAYEAAKNLLIVTPPP